MDQAIIIALIGTIPGTLGVLVSLRRTSEKQKETSTPAQHHPLRSTLLVVAGATITAALALVILWYTNRPTTVTVSATQVWTDTGIDLEPGDIVKVSASGTIFHSPHETARAGPDGVGKLYPTSVLPDKDHGALLGRVAVTGKAFFVGSKHTFVASTPGRFFLGVNDTGAEDNSGEFKAEVDVEDG